MKQMAKEYPVQEISEAFGLSRSGYYGHLEKDHRPRREFDRNLMPKIKHSFEESRGTYGCERIVYDLRDQGLRCGKTRVSRLMKSLGLKAREKRRYKPRTTITDPQARFAPNYLKMIPQVIAKNLAWSGDITYLWTLAGWVYLAAVLELFSRKCLAWKADYCMDAELVITAQKTAFSRRGSPTGLIQHSDRGSQYTSEGYQKVLSDHRVTSSMSGKGNCYDNATMESFWATLKTECFGEKYPENLEEVNKKLFNYIDGFYNTRRRHSSLGFISPLSFEKEMDKV